MNGNPAAFVFLSCVWIGAAAGLVVAYYFDWWTLFWGPHGLGVSGGTYPRILILIVGLIYLLLPPAVGMGLGAWVGGLVGFVAANALRLPTRSR
jgi:hypothetical protein